MNHFRYTLEPYKGMKTRHTCPGCQHKKCFTRYIETQTGEYLDYHVGRCSREVKCGYHYTPKDYFQDNPRVDTPRVDTPRVDTPKLSVCTLPPKPPVVSFIPQDIFMASLKQYENNHLISFLTNHFGKVITLALMVRYFVGTSKHWPGATVFWQIDLLGGIRTGKIMLYNPANGKRVKEPYKHINWVHSVLGLKDFHLEQCLFGEHLLSVSDAPVALVESEKTALIASVYLPQFIWLAVGSLSNLTANKCKVLKGRKVVLFPDLNAYDKWIAKARELPPSIKVRVSDFLEQHATPEDRAKGLDIADYLILVEGIINK
ncbi:DUF6371 domain-containing protein [Emticicia agri]|uniref:Uncharacterized protein n=1 Tax=Emticicia agri TaxID=2492393 RepID=A0A4Q5M1Y3_9BACT|nr:DUF6371 domain-containing protein [Emticicia agri]RYU96248.1 hypothetical protein EWM59_08545 [Emticicia agri]